MFLSDLGKFVFVVLNLPDNNPYVMIMFYFLVPIISVLICLTLYTLLKRYLSGICSLLTGGR